MYLQIKTNLYKTKNRFRDWAYTRPTYSQDYWRSIDYCVDFILEKFFGEPMEYIINKSEPVIEYIKKKVITINRTLSEYSFILLLLFIKIISKTIDYIINVLYLLQMFVHIVGIYIFYKTLTIYDFIKHQVLKIKSKFKREKNEI